MSEELAVAPVPPTTPSNETQIELVRIGTAYDDKGKPYHLFHRFKYNSYGGCNEIAEPLNFEINKNNRRLDGVGLIYELTEVAGKDGTTWRLGAAKYIGRWADDDERLRWSAAQALRDAAHNAEVKHKKAADDHPLQQAIEPLRALYKSQIGSNRAQLLAYIVKEIVK